MGFDPTFVQSVRDAVDLVDLVSEHTRVSKRGQRYQALCPFHKEKTPSFSIDPDRGLFYCFGCGAGGDAIGFYMQVTGDDFPTAIDALAHRYGMAVPERPSSSNRDSAADERVLGLAERFFTHHLKESQAARHYLESRSIPQLLIDDFHLGFAPDEWSALGDSLGQRLGAERLARAGLVARSEGGRIYDRFRNRLMFPIRSPAGRIVGFGGRTLGDDRAKYINTRETQSFQKGQLLFGLDRAKSHLREARRALLVEGYFDVIAAVASGVGWVVASMGTALTGQQVRILKRYADEVVIGYDGDRAGEEAGRKALRLLLAEGLSVRRARFPAGQDPDSLRLEAGPEAVFEVIENAPDAVELEIERVPLGLENEPQLQAKEAAAMRELLASVPDPVLRYAYGKRAAERLGLPEQVLGQARTSRVARPVGTERRVSEVTSLEEKVLQLLLASSVQQGLELPSPDAFLDSDCRAIYLAYRKAAGLVEGEAVVEVSDLLEHLDREQNPIDRVARILLEESPGDRDAELAECLKRLDTRWKRRRSGQLKRELLEAQRDGDQERLEELLELKVQLSHELHPSQNARVERPPNRMRS